MENTNKTPSRRTFLKGVAINAAALSAIPMGVLGSDTASPTPVKKDKAPRLPLKIMMTQGLPEPFGEKLMKISPEITLVDDEQAIGERPVVEEIENVVVEMNGVLEAAAIGVPDERSGEVVKLFVVRTDPNVSEQDILDYCHSNLTNYKRPREVEFRDELPKTNVGKILRRELRVDPLQRR